MPLPLDPLYDRLLPSMLSLMTASADELNHYYIDALSRLVTFARSQVPYYQIASPPEVPSNSTDFWQTWTLMPILTRQDIQQNNEAFRPRALPKEFGNVMEDETSGSTGTPLKCYASELEEAIFEVTDYLGHTAIAGRNLGRTLCVIKSYSGNLYRNFEGYTMRGWGRVALHFGSNGLCKVINISMPIEQQTQVIRSVMPEYLATTPSNLRELLQHPHALQPVPLQEMITFGETVTPELREKVRASLGARMRDVYSCTEAGILAFECDKHQYHIVASNSYVEILDDQGCKCPLGKVGRVVITPLYKFAMPLIRYQLDDYAEWGFVCDCGCQWPTLKSIRGRKRNMFRFPDGTIIWPALNSFILRQFVPFTTCKVAQISPLVLELRAVQAGGSSEPMNVAGLTEYIQRKLGQPVEVVVRYVTKRELYSQEKLEDYICEIT
jgi:phenylacetate-CoA ligase